MIALLGATGMALLVDPRADTGAPAWLKPAKFAASIAIYTLTLAWVFTYLPEWVKTRRVVSWITAVTLVLEIVIIDVQAWRGTTSHFNVGTLVRRRPLHHHGAAPSWCRRLSTIAVAVALWRQTLCRPGDGVGAAPRHDDHDHRRADRRPDDAAHARAARQLRGPAIA